MLFQPSRGNRETQLGYGVTDLLLNDLVLYSYVLLSPVDSGGNR